MQETLSADVRAAVKDVAARFDHAEVGEQVGLAACSAIPQLSRQRDDELVDETVLAATSNVVAIIDGLLDGADPSAITPPSVSLKWAEWLVSRNIDVSAVPWAYNFGHGRMSEALRETVVGLDLPAEDRLLLGDSLSRYVKLYVESVCAQMVDHFVRVEERWRQGAPAMRREIVEALLTGANTDAAGAGEDLSYSLERRHLAAIVWSSDQPDERPVPAAISHAAEALLRSCGATDVLVVRNGQSSVWAWGSGDVSERQADQVLLGPGMLGAIGSVADGLEGFVRSHRDAMQARHMAGLLSKRPRSVIAYRSVALTSLIASDPDQALRFLDAELGPLTQDTDSVRRLRATLSIYFEEGMRPVRTARRLGVHQNTVAYRIAQAEEAIGRPLGERRLELEAALRLADARDALRRHSAESTGP